MRSTLLTLTLVAFSTPALASTFVSGATESVTFTNVESVDAVGNAANTTLSHDFAGGFEVSSIIVEGTLTEVDIATFASEARVFATAPDGSTSGNLSNGGPDGYSGTVDVGPTSNAFGPVDAAGTWTFEFFESFVDSDGTPDQTWDTITITLSGGTIVDGDFALGTIATDETPTSMVGSHVAGGFDYYTLTIPDAITATGYFSVITQNPGATLMDTELAIYDSAGNFIATDDDDGPSLYSALSFGADPHTVGTSGSDGATLPAGTYTVVVGSFDSTFGATLGSETAGSDAGEYEIVVRALAAGDPPVGCPGTDPDACAILAFAESELPIIDEADPRGRFRPSNIYPKLELVSQIAAAGGCTLAGAWAGTHGAGTIDGATEFAESVAGTFASGLITASIDGVTPVGDLYSGIGKGKVIADVNNGGAFAVGYNHRISGSNGIWFAAEYGGCDGDVVFDGFTGGAL